MDRTYKYGKYRKGTIREKLFKALIEGSTKDNLCRIANGEITTVTGFLTSVQKPMPEGRYALLLYKGQKIFIAEFVARKKGSDSGLLKICISKKERKDYSTKRETLSDKKEKWKGED